MTGSAYFRSNRSEAPNDHESALAVKNDLAMKGHDEESQPRVAS
jgi:hypothetical protein